MPQRRRLVVDPGETEDDGAYAQDTVISQYPGPGNPVEWDHVFELTVSSAAPPAITPCHRHRRRRRRSDVMLPCRAALRRGRDAGHIGACDADAVTRSIRTPCAIAAASLLLAAAVTYAEEAGRPSPQPSAIPDASRSLAGRQAGEGRIRPGRPAGSGVSRPDDPSTSADAGTGTDVGRSARPGRSPFAKDPQYPPDPPVLPGTPPPAAGRKPDAQPLPDPATNPVSVVRLGAGILLIGLGLGFLGVRLRRR
jgi:hypothetical protein